MAHKLKLAVLALLACAAPLQADNSVALKLLGVQPLANVKNAGGTEEKVGKFGIGGGLEYNKRVLDRLSVGAEFAWVNRGEKETTTLVTGARTTLNSDTKALLLLAKYHFIPKAERFDPFLGAGLGVGVSKMKMETIPNAGFVWSATGTRDNRAIIDSSETSVAWSIRGGLETLLGSGFSLGLEANLLGTGEMTYNATDAGRQVAGNYSLKGSHLDFLIGLFVAYHFTH